MSEGAESPRPPVPLIRRGQSALVGFASVFAAGVSYLVLLVAAHQLSPTVNAEFLVFWALLFGSFGIVTGISPEAARSAHDGVQTQPGRAGARIVWTGLAFGSAVALAIGLTGIGWSRLVLPDHPGLLVVVVAACAAYSGHLALWGLLTGLRHWRGMALLMIAESAVRLGLVMLVVVTGTAALITLAVAAAASALTWTLALLLPRIRAYLDQRSDLARRALLRQYATAAAASTASAALTVGFPVLLSLTSSTEVLLGAAGLILAITLTRAPLLVPLTAFQGVALAYFLRHRSRGPAALFPILAVLGAVTVAAAGLAWWIGPWLFSTLLGSRYTIGGAILAGLVVGAGFLAAVTLSGVCCLAVRRTAWFGGGWIGATLIAVIALLSPYGVESRAVLSLVTGPACGLGVHLIGLKRAEHTTGKNKRHSHNGFSGDEAGPGPSTHPAPR